MFTALFAGFANARTRFPQHSVSHSDSKVIEPEGWHQNRPPRKISGAPEEETRHWAQTIEPRRETRARGRSARANNLRCHASTTAEPKTRDGPSL